MFHEKIRNDETDPEVVLQFILINFSLSMVIDKD